MNKKFWTRVVVWILALLMIGSCASAALMSIFAEDEVPATEEITVTEEFTAAEETSAVAETSAPDETFEAAETTNVPETTEETTEVPIQPIPPVIETFEEPVVVGLMYGNDVTVGFETLTTKGFKVYSVTSNKTERSFKEIYSIDIPKVTVVCDDNLSQTGHTYSIYNTSKKCVVGGYHVQVRENFETIEEAQSMLITVIDMLEAEGSDMHPFIAYINGAYKIRIGDYSSVERIEKKIASVPKLAEAIPLECASPSNTCVMVVDPETNVIHFEYDGGTKTKLGLRAMDKDGEKQYLRTPANRLYDGIFVYSRYKTDTANGVSLSNMLPLESYIAGVVPYEISPDWPMEALRAFAITVRGYTVKNFNRHYSAYGFDICNTTHCQVYRGIGNANAAVYEAVEGTRGLVLTNGKEIASTYYSSSTGGYTASSKDTWGGSDSSYLIPTYTPWERYSEHNKGLWISYVSGSELAEYMRGKGYNIKGDIVDIEITDYSGDGPYVYSITYTDSKGNKHVISRCDKVRTSISKYVNSANFVVGKGTLTYSYDEVVEIDLEGGYSFTSGNFSKLTEGNPKVATADGVYKIEERRTYAKTVDGEKRISLGDTFVATGDSGFYHDFDAKPAVTLLRHVETAVAENENTFIFAGKGWGHGVGLSQYGILDLANEGADAEEILKLYLPELYLADYHEIKK